MRTIKKVASHIFIDGFGGMTQGLFATLIIGTMIQQIGLLIGGSTGNVIYLLGKAAAALTSAGIGVGVAVKYGESRLSRFLQPSPPWSAVMPARSPAAHSLWTEMPFWQDLANRSALSSQLSQASPAAIWFPARPRLISS